MTIHTDNKHTYMFISGVKINNNTLYYLININALYLIIGKTIPIITVSHIFFIFSVKCIRSIYNLAAPFWVILVN